MTIDPTTLGNITSADAVVIMRVETIYPTGVELTGFATDSMWDVAQQVMAEVKQGADGQTYAGWIPQLKEITFHLESPSPARGYLQNVAATQEKNKTVYATELEITLPALKERFKLYSGALQAGQPIPTAAATLQAGDWVFKFGKVDYEKY